MCAQKAGKGPGVLWSVFNNKCPRCRQGDLYLQKNPYKLKTTTKMPETCPVCGQKFELEPGFWFGTGYVSYAFAVMLTGITFVIWWFTIGISIRDNSIFWWLGANGVVLVLLQPVIQRWSRSAWISFFVRYERPVADSETEA